MIIKKAAMFGLDARIALAIFGALSVISGAALYSAIQDARVTSIIAELNEYGKAYEQFLLDTGTEPAMTPFHMHAKELVESTKAGWQGPYFDYTAVPNDIVVTVSNSLLGGNISLVYEKLADKTWNSDNNWDVEHCAGSTGEDCYMWVRFEFSDKYLETVKQLDLKIDGTAGRNEGNFRYIHFTTPKAVSIFYKYSVAMNQSY
tara:strand:+ start:5373 stop:5981 length:609 start_codon:yes stop_codon:yes gene_type:complete